MRVHSYAQLFNMKPQCTNDVIMHTRMYTSIDVDKRVHERLARRRVQYCRRPEWRHFLGTTPWYLHENIYVTSSARCVRVFAPTSHLAGVWWFEWLSTEIISANSIYNSSLHRLESSSNWLADQDGSWYIWWPKNCMELWENLPLLLNSILLTIMVIAEKIISFYSVNTQYLISSSPFLTIAFLGRYKYIRLHFDGTFSSAPSLSLEILHSYRFPKKIQHSSSIWRFESSKCK